MIININLSDSFIGGLGVFNNKRGDESRAQTMNKHQ